VQLARVTGTVVSTVKNDSLEGRKLLVIQPLDAELRNAGKPVIAVDSAGAGAGEIVFWCRGRESSFPFVPVEVPTDCTVVGIVDTVFTRK
jgi:microcompartment protein CcmK/EutM